MPPVRDTSLSPLADTVPPRMAAADTSEATETHASDVIDYTLFFVINRSGNEWVVDTLFTPAAHNAKIIAAENFAAAM